MRGFIEVIQEIRKVCAAHTCEDCPFKTPLDPQYYDPCYFADTPVGWNTGLILDILKEQRRKGENE